LAFARFNATDGTQNWAKLIHGSNSDKCDGITVNHELSIGTILMISKSEEFKIDNNEGNIYLLTFNINDGAIIEAYNLSIGRRTIVFPHQSLHAFMSADSSELVYVIAGSISQFETNF